MLTESISDPNKTQLKKLLEEHWDELAAARGSKYKHQAWEGGYLDHIAETIGIARIIYPALSDVRPLTFSLSDAILVLMLHDLEKPWKHTRAGAKWEDNKELASLKDRKLFVFTMAAQYGIELTPDQVNALTYLEGEGDEWTPEARVQGPLAAFVGCCDVISARIWFDRPINSTDLYKLLAG